MNSKKNILGIKQPVERHKLFQVSPIVKKAPEPSNIIWENYSVSRSDSYKFRLIALVVVLLIYSLFFYVSMLLYSYQTSYDEKFSDKTNCHEIDYGFELKDGTLNMTNYLHYAKADRNNSMNGEGFGVYQCFCKH